MNEPKPEDVMRALECCEQHGKCKECPLKDKGIHGCMFYLMHHVIILLREKDADIDVYKARVQAKNYRIEELTQANAELTQANAELTQANAEKDAEIERLKGALKAEERHNELTMECAKKALANARAETERKKVSHDQKTT